MARLQQLYREEIAPLLMREQNYSSIMIPRPALAAASSIKKPQSKPPMWRFLMRPPTRESASASKPSKMNARYASSSPAAYMIEES